MHAALDTSKQEPAPERGGVILAFLVCLAGLGALACYFLPGLTLRPLGDFLYVSEAGQPSDGIVVLLGGEGPDRVLKANELLKAGLAKRIVFGTGFTEQEALKGAPPGFIWVPSSMQYRMAFESLGITREQLEYVDTVDRFDTSGELSAVADHARAKGWSSIILVSSATHSRRVSIIWRRIAPDITGFVMSPADPSLSRWWQVPRLVRAVGYEYGALTKELVRQIGSLFGGEPEGKPKKEPLLPPPERG